ncbi:tRNA methyltransferase, has a role in tRNA modification [Cryptotrichosporon argae]
MPKAIPVPVAPFERPADAEERTVHEVYEAIAPHFAKTRFKPWPIIDAFLRSQPAGSLGLDAGAGNGKYLPVAAAAGSHMVALDRSANLLSIARDIGGECVRADLGGRCWRDGVFDYAISIAAIHHLSTPLRRQHAVQALLRALCMSSEPPYARFMIYVWAYEQGERSRRKMGSAAEGGALSAAGDAAVCSTKPGSGAAECLQGASEAVAGAAEPSQPSNEGGTSERAAPRERAQDVLVPWVRAEDQVVYQRYYHLFVGGELEELVQLAAEAETFTYVGATGDQGGVARDGEADGGRREREGQSWVRMRGYGWEADNWWFEGEVGRGPIQ